MSFHYKYMVAATDIISNLVLDESCIVSLSSSIGVLLFPSYVSHPMHGVIDPRCVFVLQALT